MKRQMICPECGKKTEFETNTTPFKMVIGRGFSEVQLIYDCCSECGCEFDINHQNDKIMKVGLSAALQNCAMEILNDFSDKKNYSEVERLYFLPRHTLSKWKKREKKPSAAAVMLLRLMDLLPWLDDAAEEHFEPEMVNQIATKYYADQFHSKMGYLSYVENADHQQLIATFPKKKTSLLNQDSVSLLDEKQSFAFSPIVNPGVQYETR